MKTLIVEPLTADAFAPFGQVIEAGKQSAIEINEGTTKRYDQLAKVELNGNDAEAAISIFRGTPRQQPIAIRMMECHPLGSQAFMPLSDQPYYVVVALAGETVSGDDLRCFLALPGQGVNYTSGTWHHPLLSLGEVSDFLVIDRAGSGDNLIECWFEGTDIRLLSEV